MMFFNLLISLDSFKGDIVEGCIWLISVTRYFEGSRRIIVLAEKFRHILLLADNFIYQVKTSR